MDARTKLEETFFAPVGSMLPAHDTCVVDRDGWHQITTPSSGSSIGNEVAYSRLAADAEEVVRQTIRDYAEHGVAFKWNVGPLTEPADFGALLERYGFTWTDIKGMAIATTSEPPASPGVSVDLVTQATVAEFFATFMRGWGDEVTLDPVEWIAHHARAIAAGTHEMYLARIDGIAAGTAGIAIKPRSGYLIGGNTLAEYRRRGVYRAMVGARLRSLAGRGIPLATTQARESSSAPLLERMGFETIYRGRIYRCADPRALVARFSL